MTELKNADAIQSISNSILVLKDRIVPLMSYVGTIATSVPFGIGLSLIVGGYLINRNYQESVKDNNNTLIIIKGMLKDMKYNDIINN